jgi:hypothetical protein
MTIIDDHLMPAVDTYAIYRHRLRLTPARLRLMCLLLNVLFVLTYAFFQNIQPASEWIRNEAFWLLQHIEMTQTSMDLYGQTLQILEASDAVLEYIRESENHCLRKLHRMRGLHNMYRQIDDTAVVVDEKDDEDRCIICRDATPDQTGFQCEHVYCLECCRKMESCPQCRAPGLKTS